MIGAMNLNGWRGWRDHLKPIPTADLPAVADGYRLAASRYPGLRNLWHRWFIAWRVRQVKRELRRRQSQ